METSKLDFTVVVAFLIMHDFKFEPSGATLRYLTSPLKKAKITNSELKIEFNSIGL